MVIFGHGTFTFEDLDGDGLLVILIGGEDLGLFGGDEGTTGNDGGHDTSHSFDTQTQGSGINDDHLI